MDVHTRQSIPGDPVIIAYRKCEELLDLLFRAQRTREISTDMALLAKDLNSLVDSLWKQGQGK